VRGILSNRVGRGAGISIICVYNNLEKLDRYLIPSLEKQTAAFELLAIDNTAGKHMSAPAILNQTAKKATYEYLMFVHQDVSLCSKTWLADAQRDMRFLPRLGAAGVAGRNVIGLFAAVRHGIPPKKINRKRFFCPIRVQTIDGCLMIIPKKIFKAVLFDEKVIKGWYLYSVNFCLDLLRLGYRSYVLPRRIYHESTGPKDRSRWHPTMQEIIEKHCDHVRKIYTTLGIWET